MLRIRPTYAEIDDGALRANVRVIRRTLGESTRIVAVVKADGYGHGAIRAARAFLEAGAWGVAVSLAEEGLALRHAGIRAPILVLGGPVRGYEDLIVQQRLTPAVWSAEQLERLSASVRRAGVPAWSVHLKVDTGLSRWGALPEELPALLDRWAAEHRPTISIDGVMTHLASADLVDDAQSDQQLERFRAALALLQARGLAVRLRHAANSAGALRYPRARFDLVRLGLALYGVDPTPRAVLADGLSPALAVHSRVGALRRLAAGTTVSYGATARLTRPSVLAVVPAGYEDGFPRALGSGGVVLVRGRRAPIVGAVTMDAMMVDVTEIPDVEEGTVVTLLGSQGGARIDVREHARWTGRIPYEVLCGISSRVPRV